MKQDSAAGPATLTTTRRGGSQLKLRVALLRVIEGPDQGMEHEITADPVTIGTKPPSAMLLTDQTVSGRHAEVVLAPAGYLIRDLGSKNGVLVNDVRVERAYLAAGARLTLGATRMVVVDPRRVETFELSRASQYGSLLGTSIAMRRLFASLERASASDLTVLLTGETGTGKTLVARELHRHGATCDGPFEVLDCGSVQSNLIESELFGHEKGAFTGAVSSHAGAIERAHGGTLFLDEITELPLALQPRLLRALDSRQFVKVGGSKVQTARVRFIAATNRRLEQAVQDGLFRSDLYFRLAVIRIEVPPLRQRVEDLPLLIEHFARGLPLQPEGQAPTDRLRGLAPLLAAYDWPGNVRELRNVVERLAYLDTSQAIPSAMREAKGNPGSYDETRQQALDQFERTYLRQLLRHTRGNVARAADLAGVSKRYLFRLMAKHEIDRRDAARGRTS